MRVECDNKRRWEVDDWMVITSCELYSYPLRVRVVLLEPVIMSWAAESWRKDFVGEQSSVLILVVLVVVSSSS